MLPLTLVPRITAAFFASCLPSKREGLVAMRSSFRESAMILARLRFFWCCNAQKSSKVWLPAKCEISKVTGIFSGMAVHFSVAPQRKPCDIIAVRHRPR